MVTELGRCSLDKWIESRGGRVSQWELGSIMMDVLRGLVYLHEHGVTRDDGVGGVVHRDLRPGNVLMFYEEGSSG